MRKLILLVILFMTTVTLISCNTTQDNNNDDDNGDGHIDPLVVYGPNYKEENTMANKEYLYGMCDLAWSEYSWNPNNPIDYTVTSQLIKNLGCKSVRNWMHCNWLMDNPTTFNEKNLALAHEIVDDLVAQGYQIIGMNHSNFHAKGYANSSSTVAKPARDLSDGSDYLKWLDDYETTWYNIAKEFPEIMYWEIDNESNSDTFFEKLTGGTFTLRQKADIYTDMLYFASRGIHRANPNANTVMGGLVISTAETFLEYIYENIYADDSWSQYPDDYFQIAAWHPYMAAFTPDKFRKTNEDIYKVIRTNEGKDKKVFITEFGFSEANATREKIADVFDEFQDGLDKEQPDREVQRIKAKIAHIESAIEDGLPFDRDRLLALHARLDEIESKAIRAPKRFARHEVLALLESAAQMDAQRAIDIFVDCVVYDDERTAVSFSFDDAPTSDERLAQIVNWWTRTKSTPTIHAIRGGVVLVA